MAKTKTRTAKKPVAKKTSKTKTTTRARAAGKDSTKKTAKTKSRAKKKSATKTVTAKKTTTKKVARSKNEQKKSPKEAVVTVDRRRNDRRADEDRRQKQEPVAVERRKIERRAKVNRRRQIDPTTCERDYHAEELEFMSALDAYKRTSGRMFPTCSEILEVIRGLGYAKPAEDDQKSQDSTQQPEGAPTKQEEKTGVVLASSLETFTAETATSEIPQS